jgi:hypothetical protein
MAKYGPDPTLRDMILGQVVKMALLEEAHAAHRKELSAVKSAVSALRSKIDGTGSGLDRNWPLYLHGQVGTRYA